MAAWGGLGEQKKHGSTDNKKEPKLEGELKGTLILRILPEKNGGRVIHLPGNETETNRRKTKKGGQCA